MMQDNRPFTKTGGWRENHLHRLAEDIYPVSPAGSGDMADSIVTTDNPDVLVSAIKPASRGRGVIVRLYALPVPESPVRMRTGCLRAVKATLCDARERDLQPLEVKDGSVLLTLPGTVTSVRLEQE